MAEIGGLPGWIGTWVGKVVQVHLHGTASFNAHSSGPIRGTGPQLCRLRASKNVNSYQ
jgi:hypothetical protein